MDRAWRRGAAAALSGLALLGCAHRGAPGAHSTPRVVRPVKPSVAPDPTHRQYFDERRRRYYYFDRQKREYFWENGDLKS